METPAHKFFDAVYSVLVEKAGASETFRGSFILRHIEREHACNEWRIGGKLGYGGKYWRERNAVSCYIEDSTPERDTIIEETNKALSSLK